MRCGRWLFPTGHHPIIIELDPDGSSGLDHHGHVIACRVDLLAFQNRTAMMATSCHSVKGDTIARAWLQREWPRGAYGELRGAVALHRLACCNGADN